MSSKALSWMSISWLLLLAIVIGGVGCTTESPQQSTVRGTVTLDGAPLTDGLINFVAVDLQSPTVEAKIANGSFEVAVLPGDKRVEIRAPKVTGKKKVYDTPDSPTVDIVEERLPSRYNSQSELQMTVVEGPQEKTFELQSR